MSDKFAFSGRLRSGKDHCAEALGCTVLSVSEFIRPISRHYLGIDDKKDPVVRKFAQLVGTWGRGTDSAVPDGMPLPSRGEVTAFLRESASLILPPEFLGMNWEQFGQHDEFWLNAILHHTRQKFEENPDCLVAVVNARYPNEIVRYKAAGFQHLHVKCSFETRRERIKDYDPSLDADISERMAAEFDAPGVLEERCIVWNDHRPQPDGAHYMTVQEMVSCYGRNSLAAPPGAEGLQHDERIQPSAPPI